MWLVALYLFAVSEILDEWRIKNIFCTNTVIISSPIYPGTVRYQYVTGSLITFCRIQDTWWMANEKYILYKYGGIFKFNLSERCDVDVWLVALYIFAVSKILDEWRMKKWYWIYVQLMFKLNHHNSFDVFFSLLKIKFLIFLCLFFKFCDKWKDTRILVIEAKKI